MIRQASIKRFLSACPPCCGVGGSLAMDLCTLRLTVQTMIVCTDNPRMPWLSVIMAYPPRILLKGPLPDCIRGCEDAEVCLCVCLGLA